MEQQYMKTYRSTWEEIGITQATIRVPNEGKAEIVARAALLRAVYLVEIATEEGMTHEKKALANRNVPKPPYYKVINSIEEQGYNVDSARSAVESYNVAVAALNGLDDKGSDRAIELTAQALAYSALANAELNVVAYTQPPIKVTEVE